MIPHLLAILIPMPTSAVTVAVIAIVTLILGEDEPLLSLFPLGPGASLGFQTEGRSNRSARCLLGL